MMKLKPFLLIVLIIITAVSCVNNSDNQWEVADNPILTRWTSGVDPSNPWPEYPRPGLVRDEWLNLNGLWDYAISPYGDRPLIWEGKILVPYPVQSALSGVKKMVDGTEKLWYRREIIIPEDWSGKRILLNMEASDWETTVEVDGQVAGVHKGGYDPFSFDITAYLGNEKAHELVISVWDPTDSGEQPRGKQVSSPRSIWYTPVTGIWQTVWLEPVEDFYIRSFRVYTDTGNGTLTIEPEMSECADGLSVNVLVKDNETIIAEATAPVGQITISIPDFEEWAPGAPKLYNLEITLINEGRVCDNLTSYFGFREISLGKDDSGFTKMLLNGHFVFQNGPLDQGFWPDGIYTPPSEEAMVYDLEMIQKMGFNMLRKHVKVENRRFYYWCDRMGLLVWQDMPSGDRYIGGSDPDITRSQESAAQYEIELARMIETKFNHPSIIVWVPFNEGWGQFETGRITNLVKKSDPTRLVNSASGWTDRGTGDFNDIHNYPEPRSPEPEENRAIVLGEFGGLGLPVQGHTWEETNWGYQNMADRTELLSMYEDFYAEIYDMVNHKGLSAVVYTQITDVETETNGLLTYDREVDKMGYENVFLANTGILPPRLVSDGRIFTEEYNAVLECYSPLAEIYYTLDGTKPTEESNLYTGRVTINSDTELKIVAVYPAGSSAVRSYTITKRELSPATEVTGLATGLKASIYKGYWKSMPDISVMEPETEIITPVISCRIGESKDSAAIRFEGFLKIPADGVYGFYLVSDDGSRLFLDNNMVIDNDGIHGMRERIFHTALAAGHHPLMVDFFQCTGDKGLKLYISGPGLPKEEVPSNMFFR